MLRRKTKIPTQKIISMVFHSLRRYGLPLAGAVFSYFAFAHSVGQVQTTKFFAPETVQVLKARVAAGQPAGFQVGDTVTYIIQFSPIANNAAVGANGYITDYIPPGTQVIGASYVNKSGTVLVAGDTYDNYVTVSPSLPGGMPAGWGGSNGNTYTAPFNVNAYDTTGRCASAGIAAGACNGRLSDLYADTGIFYSTDPRTQVFPVVPTRIVQGLNGYFVNATREGQLNPIIGQADATTHNLWDAAMTNAFGTSAGVGLPTATPNANAVVGRLSSTGSGPIPFGAGSPVAGPQTGYPLDYTAQVGPWQRIAYSGSRMGDITLGPARADSQSAPLGDNATGLVNATPYPLFVTGNTTPLGYNVSSNNPLPSGTNAVRWAVGKLVVGQISYVKISLRLTAPVPAEGIINSSEVFGGDASDLTGTGTGGSIDNPWVYHVPSVADNNSNLYVSKTACQYDPTATTCVPLGGTYFAADSTITYQITYLNTGNNVQTNVALSDVMPCQTAANTSVRVGTVTGPLLAIITPPPYTTTVAAAGNCATTPQTRSTVTFPTLASLQPGAGGLVILNVRNTATTVNDDVVNTARLTSASVPSGIVSSAVTFVGNTANPALVVNKTALLSTGTAGGTAQYTIVVKNVGTGPALGVQLDDILPSTGGALVDPTLRFNYASLGPVTSTGLSTASLVTTTSTAALFTPTLSPYSTQAGAANMVRVNFNFGAASSLAAGGVITLTFNVTIGAGMAASATPYYNNLVAQATQAPLYRVDLANAAPITINSALTLAKTLDCYYVGTTCVPANTAGTIPPNSRVRYRIDYANTGGGALSNVVLTDTLPCQISATAAPEMTVTAVTTGLIGGTMTLPFAVQLASGTCPSVRPGYTFTAVPLAAGQTGSLSMEVQLTTPSTTSNVVVNDVAIASGSISANAQHQATVLANPNLLISKTASPSIVPPGGTLSYTITITNVGTTAAQTITVYDWLPTGTTVTNSATQRFNFVTTTAIVGLNTVTTAVNLPPTQAPYSGDTFAANQQELVWSFGTQTLAVGATASIVITVQAGTSLVALPPPNYYYNNTKVTYFNGQQAGANATSANVSLASNLSVTKTNNTATLAAGSTTSYTVTFSNGGPSAANGALIKDLSSAGLQCTSVTCAATTGGASCPSSMVINTVVPATATLFFGAGETIPTFPANSAVSLLVNCRVTATGQ
jgi:uncharacterized repeat protein (TIGR01451 family)